MIYLRIFLIFLLLSANYLFAAFAKDAYFAISGSLATGDESDLKIALNQPTILKKLEDGVGAALSSSNAALSTAVDNFNNAIRDSTLTKSISMGLNANFGYAFTSYFRTEFEGFYSKGKITSSSSDLYTLFFPSNKPVKTASSNQASAGAINLNLGNNSGNNNVPIDNTSGMDKYSLYSVMMNFILDIDNGKSNIVPFAGFGIGAEINNFWNSNVTQMIYKFVLGIDISLTPYLNAVINADYIKYQEKTESIFSLKRHAIVNAVVGSAETADYILYNSGTTLKANIVDKGESNRLKFTLGLKFII